MTLPTITSAMLLQTLGVTVGEHSMANGLLRGTLTTASTTEPLTQRLGLPTELHGSLDKFIGGEEPSEPLLAALHERSDILKTLVSGGAALATETGRVSLSSVPPVPEILRNPGLKMPKPDAGFGLVLADFDKTLFGGDSHLRLVSLGLRTRLDELRKLENRVWRLLETAKMTYRYKTHQLDPKSAAGAVATLLADVPVLQVARDWADAGARAGIKRGVLRLVHEEARAIVRAEVDELIKQGRMAEPLSDSDVEEEAKTRIFTVSSQFSNVLKMLTDVGPDHENLLGFNVENVLGSLGNFTPEGNFVDDNSFRYCFDENKPRIAEEEFKRRGIEFNPDTLRAFTDDVWYDRFLLAMAHEPGNRFIIDPDSRDSDYARHEGAQVVYDQWDLSYRARWVANLKARSKKNKLEVVEDRRFYPDTRSVASTSDAWNRAIWGAAEMIPLAVAEGIQHGVYGEGVHPAAVAIILGSGMLYGPMNRSAKGSVVVGALLAGGLAAVHVGHISSVPIIAAAAGGALALGQGLIRSLIHKNSATELGAKGFRAQTRLMSFIGRTGVTGAWFTAMRLLGLG